MRGSTCVMLLALGALLAGCAGDPAPADRFYRLSVPEMAQAGEAPVLNGRLEVGRPTATGLLNERNLIYAEGGGGIGLNREPYDFWVEPPALLVQTALREALAAAEIAPSVTTPEERLDPAYLLRTELTRFEGDRAAATAVVSFSALLTPVRGREPLFQGRYEEREPVAAADPASPAGPSDPAAVAAALDRALGRAILRLIADLRAAGPLAAPEPLAR